MSTDQEPAAGPVPSNCLVTQTQLADLAGVKPSNVRSWHVRKKIDGLAMERPVMYDRRVAVDSVKRLEAERQARVNAS